MRDAGILVRHIKTCRCRKGLGPSPQSDLAISAFVTGATDVILDTKRLR